MMKVSASVDLVWQLAAREAAAGSFREIQPEHFLCALLKFAEIDTDSMRKLAAGSDALSEVTTDLEAIRSDFAAMSVDTTQTRRALRQLLGDGGTAYDGGVLHRSSEARAAFDRAVSMANEEGSGLLRAIHILRAVLDEPTEAINQVFDTASSRSSRGGRGSTPLIDLHGKDLLPPPGFEPPNRGECKAVVQALGNGRRAITLVTDDYQRALSCMSGVAAELSSGPQPSSLKGAKVVDMGSLGGEALGKSELTGLAADVMAEADSAGRIILVMPYAEQAAAVRWAEAFSKALDCERAFSILPVSPAAYEHLCGLDSKWKESAQAIWLSDSESANIPWEL